MAPVVDPVLRRARLGVTLIFMTNGMVWANLAPRFPEIRTNLGLSYGQFGIAVMFSGFGALAFGLAAAAVIRRFSSARVGLVGMTLMSVAALVAVVVDNGYLFAAAFFVLGAIDSFVDVAQNAHGLRVQREYKRTIINAFHGMWSVGAVLGGLMAAAAAGLGISVPVHLAIVAVLLTAVNVFAYTLLLKGPDTVSEEVGAGEAARARRKGFPRVPARVWLMVGALSLIAISGAWVEDAAISWSASYLHDELDAGATVAAFGFVALMAMHFVGRMIGDGLIDKYGQRLVTRVGGIITAVGMGIALLWPSIPLTIVGFGLAGLGVATTIPVAMHVADELPGFRHGTGLTILSWVLRFGFMLSPVIVGAIADQSSLRNGLTLVVVAGVVVAVLAQVLSPRPNTHALDSAAAEPHPAP